ncbi:hypothetical protein B0H10DRAFT_602089 [Mycena sp. CBHHK59/15]|nr:hypothetical protein B0H10DRAFT_602089 [Mycena sp. CBHHK59/15]
MNGAAPRARLVLIILDAEMKYEISPPRRKKLEAQKEKLSMRSTLLFILSFLSPLKSPPRSSCIMIVFLRSAVPHSYITPYSSDAPILLLRIWRAWRDIALNHPPLWSFIECYTKKEPKTRGNRLFYVYSPISALTGSWTVSFPSASIFGNVGSCTWSSIPPYLLIGSCSLSRLPFLTKLLKTQIWAIGEWDYPVNFLSDAPQLRELHLAPPASLVILPWIQKTRLKLSDLTVKPCLDVLSLTPHLLHYIDIMDVRDSHQP